MQKRVRIAKEAALAVLTCHDLRLDERPYTRHPKFAVVDPIGAVRAFLTFSSSPRSGDTEARNMARQQATRVLVRLGLA